MSSQQPEHVRQERNRSLIWGGITNMGVLLIWVTIIGIGPVIGWASGRPLNRYTMESVARYMEGLWPNPWYQMSNWYWGEGPGTPIGLILWMVTAFFMAGLVAVVMHKLNPYRRILMIHGDARFADARDIAAMDRGKQIGPSGKYTHLGNFKGKAIRLIETLTITAIAPPGTGKTARLIVPTILSTDEASLIIHDPKPELWEITSGYRSSLGPCFRLDWSSVDDADEGEGLWNPAFNFLDPRIIPPPGGQRDTLIDSLAKTLVAEKNGKGDDYFQQQGRAALVGLLHFLIAKINDRTDEGRYENLPKKWHGMSASMPMLVDWLMESQLAAGDQGGEDPLKPYFQSLVQESRDNGYPDRVVRELQPLINMADKERSGVLGTMGAGLQPFKNAAVVERTCTSDFTPSDLRGIITRKAQKRLGIEGTPRTKAQWSEIVDKLRPEDWRPVTVMACINQVDAPAFESITALFFELCSKTLLAYGPGEDTALGIRLGPYPVVFVMDEMVKMARCDAVMDGPDLGRSKKCSYIFVAQAIDQFERKYSKEQKNTIMSTAAVRYLLAQNDASTIQEMAKVVGTTTGSRKSTSRQVGMSKNSNPFAGNQSENLDKLELINQNTLAQMKPGTHMLIVQNFLPRPVILDSPMYFLDPILSKRAFNPRIPYEQNEFKPTEPLPDWMMERKRRELRIQREEEAIAKETDRLMYYIDVDKMAQTPMYSP